MPNKVSDALAKSKNAVARLQAIPALREIYGDSAACFAERSRAEQQELVNRWRRLAVLEATYRAENDPDPRGHAFRETFGGRQYVILGTSKE
jgi:hypothetical protein